jgi:subtilisin family serine protease
MNIGIFTLRKHGLAAAAALLLAVALTAGTLFAANERQQQPELPTVSQQSVMDATDPIRAVQLPEAPPAPERVFTQPDDNYEEETDLPPIVKTPPRYSNLDSNLNRLVDEASSAQQTRSADGGASATVEPVLVTFYIEPERVADVREYLETNGVFVRNVGEDYIEAHVLPSMLGAASEQPGILRVDTVIPPRRSQSQNRVISQGVGLHGADAWHNVGYRGDSVKVGVIDGGFERFRQLQQGGELASNVVARCYFADARSPSSRLSDCEKDGDHGTAVAETTLDVAPNATLYVANPFSKGDMQDAARWMATQGVQVINHSVGRPFDGPGDGTSPFSNSPLRTIDSAVASGAMWVNAAGNGARKTWYGTFRTPNRSTTDVQFHHWSSDDIGNSFALREGDSITAFMRWDDSWGTADCDLDLVLWRSLPAIQQILIIDADLRFQNGSQGSVPFAIVSREEVASWQEGIYFLTISKDNPNSCPDDPAWIQLVAWVDYPELQYHSPTHHMGNPEESRNPGFLAVGATHYWNTNAIAPYSNRGPALDGRTKPDITGVACGQSTVYAPDTLDDGTECWFSGTSQAAPHVAGLAALVRQRFADYNPVQTVRYLQQNAADRGPSGADNTWGYGLAVLPSPSAEPTSGSGDIAPTGNIAVRNGINSGEVTISWDAVPAATHYRIGYVNMKVDYHLAKASCTGEWIEAFVYVDVNARNIPVSNGRAQYTVRRLSPGAKHAFTVLTSNNFVDTGSGGSVSSEFFWPSNLRWRFLLGRDTLPPGVTIPPLDCPQ